MTITHSVQQEFLDDETKSLICIPCHPNVPTFVESDVHNHLVGGPASSLNGLVVSEPPPLPLPVTGPRLNATPESTKGERWTEDEHERFLLGMELFKAGPWKKIAGVVGTRDARQTMSHAQKYRQKIKRRKLGLQTPSDYSHRDVCESYATSSTKRMRTAIAVEAADALQPAHRAERNTRRLQVSPRVQLPLEALGDGTAGFAPGREWSTGLIPAQTNSAAVSVVSDACTPAGVMVGSAIEQVEPSNQQLDATLEPLEIAVSVVHDSSWLGPDELWDFLDGRQRPAADVVGVCAEGAHM